MDLSIVIVSYNVRDCLPDCLDSIRNHLSAISYEVIVVDNHSSDGTPEFVKTAYPWVRLISNPSNAGFGRANNQGFDIASGRLTLILNPDTFLLDDSLLRMIERIDQDHRIGAVGPKTLAADRLSVQPTCCRRAPSLADELRVELLAQIPGATRRLSRAPPPDQYSTERDVEALSGSCILVRSDLLRRLGGFDTDFFAYAEDLDLCSRIRDSGFRLLYLPAATIVHVGGVSFRKADLGAYTLSLETKFLYFRKHSWPTTAWAYRILVPCMRTLSAAAKGILWALALRWSKSARRWRDAAEVIRWMISRKYTRPR